ncbi:MAG: ABC transporter ATP-binding protein [bacterium]
MISISADSITKNYGKIIALDNISFNVEQGEIFGLIGADGCGKSTLIKIFVTAQLATSGKAKVEGFDVNVDYKKIRKIIGYMPGKFSLYHDLSIEENIKFFASVFGTTLNENYEIIKEIYQQIEPFKDRRAGKLSGGMKQKLALSCALIHKPKVLFLDEPTTGVDAVSRKEFWQLLKRLREREITIVVSTPYMDEALQCDRIALIQKGKTMAIDKPDKITKHYGNTLFAVKSNNIYKLINDLRDNENTKTCYAFGEYVHLTLKDNNIEINLTKDYLKFKGHNDIEIKITNPTIEDCFIELMSN